MKNSDMKNSKVKIIISSAFIFISMLLVSISSIIAHNLDKPIIISSVNELKLINENLSGYYVLGCDINFASETDYEGWVPVGSKDKPFTGRIDFNYHKIIGLTFSQEYIESQFHNNNDVVVGFLGYSEGTLIHARFDSPVLPDFSMYSLYNNSIIFGVACAVNNGYLTSTSINFIGANSSNLIKAQNLTFGALVGINNKQVLLCKILNTILLEISGECNVGGVVGISNNGVNSYLFRGGFFQINITEKGSYNIGGLVGVCINSDNNNLFFGSPSKTGGEYSLSVYEHSQVVNKFNVGGVIGLISDTNNLNTKVNNACVNNLIGFFSEDEEIFIGGIVGGHESSGQTPLLSSCVFAGSFTVPNKIIPSVLVGEGESFDRFKTYYLEECKFNSDYIEGGAIKVGFEELTLQELGWPSNTNQGFWSKETSCFYLNI